MPCPTLSSAASWRSTRPARSLVGCPEVAAPYWAARGLLSSAFARARPLPRLGRLAERRRQLGDANVGRASASSVFSRQ